MNEANNIHSVLVLGGTGLVGRNATRQLAADGFRVRVVSRDAGRAAAAIPQGVECVEADLLEDEAALRSAMSTADGLFISLPDTLVESVMPTIMAAALEHGVRQVVYVSGNTVCAENADHPMIQGHYAAERCIEVSGVPFTILKPTMVMDTIPTYANNGKPFLIGRQPNPWSWIHTEDIARYVSAAFNNPATRNRKLPVVGLDSATMAEAIDRFNAVHHPGAKPARGINIHLAKAISLLLGAKFRRVVSIFEYFSTHRENSDASETHRLLGVPQVRLDAFIAQPSK